MLVLVVLLVLVVQVLLVLWVLVLALKVVLLPALKTAAATPGPPLLHHGPQVRNCRYSAAIESNWKKIIASFLLKSFLASFAPAIGDLIDRLRTPTHNDKLLSTLH